MIFSVALAVLSRLPVKIDGACLGSPGRIGTENVPFSSNDPTTSITGIRAYLSADSQPFLWIYSAANGTYTMQVNVRNIAAARELLEPADVSHAFDRPSGGSMNAVLLRASEFEKVDNALSRAGTKHVDCFVPGYPKR